MVEEARGNRVGGLWAALDGAPPRVATKASAPASARCGRAGAVAQLTGLDQGLGRTMSGAASTTSRAPPV